MNRTILTVALTTYYGYKAQTPGANDFPARELVCWVKYNKPEWCKTFDVSHPSHPSPSPVRISKRQDAIKWVADVVAHNREEILDALGLEHGPVAFVPIPTSSVVASDRNTARWGARDIANALAALGLGRAVLAVLNKQASISKAQGAHQTIKDLRDNYVAFEQLPSGLPVIYIDDVLTWGHHVVAVDRALGRPPGAGLVVVGAADGEPRDALVMRARKVTMAGGEVDPTVENDD